MKHKILFAQFTITEEDLREPTIRDLELLQDMIDEEIEERP